MFSTVNDRCNYKFDFLSQLVLVLDLLGHQSSIIKVDYSFKFQTFSENNTIWTFRDFEASLW